jgi:ribosomal protein S18 acetylase RimI-like enzyme
MLEIVSVEPDSHQIRALGRFMLDAWKRAGPQALGWTGANDDTIREISSENYLTTLVSNPKLKFFLSMENDEITGFAVNRVVDSSTMELAGIIVRDDLLGKGIGSHLISKCIAFARNAGFANMMVKTETSNKRAIKFYMNKGFVHSGNVVETVENAEVKLAEFKLVL